MNLSDDTLCILGGGLSGLCCAHFSDKKSVIFEKEKKLGGLCRSFDFNSVKHDIGPHIFFSKDKESLGFLTSLTLMNKKKRSNKIFYKGRFVKYPFENELSALPADDRRYCLESFIENPYRKYSPANMLMFFYKTFGQGITRCYLEPYNRKIWKYEPCFMDTQMVERIPAPAAEDIIASAAGESTEGYLHQLYFSYPQEGGTESIIKSLKNRCESKTRFYTSSPIQKLQPQPDKTFRLIVNDVAYDFKEVISTIPVHELIACLEPKPPADVVDAVNNLKYNSIHITMVNAAKDNLGDNFAVMVPDPDICFHRLSKIDFLGSNYHIPGTSTIMAETTFREGQHLDMPPEAISDLVIEGLDQLNLVARDGINSIKTQTFKYAYVIYDLDHRANIDKVLGYLNSVGIVSAGRFARFEYINMDAAVKIAKAINFC